MVRLDIPGFGRLRVHHIVLDFNGTLAVDGRLLPGVKWRLRTLARSLQIHVLTADTHSSARRALAGLPCTVRVLATAGQDRAKRAYVRALRPRGAVCIGNGRNDRLMLGAATLGIAVVQAEGAASVTVRSAGIVVTSVLDALDLLLKPLRLVASLRS